MTLTERPSVASDADLTVDLRDVRFMDASTVSVLLRTDERLEPRLRTLTLRAPARCARRVIDRCHLDLLVEPVTGTSKETTWNS
jgi:anti-anti-sigma regulatory factor